MNKMMKDKASILTLAGIIAMMLLILTKFTAMDQLVGYSLLVGIPCFFIVEWIAKTPQEDSGLRFRTFFADLKKCGVLLWLVYPVVSVIADLIVGSLLFDHLYIDHVIGRTDSILNYENFLVLIGQFLIGAMGEEIAFRGFFTGKGMKLTGFWPVALCSSVFFALAHLAEGSPAIVIYDLAGIFLDAIVYSLIYRKTGNCLISMVCHFLINTVAVVLIFLFF